MDHRDRCTPVTLSGDEPVTESVVDLPLAHADLGKFFYDSLLSLVHLHAVELVGVNEVTLLLAVRKLVFDALLGLYYADDVESVLMREIEVSVVV